MNRGSEASTIPFDRGDWVLDRHNPGQPGQYTGRHRMAGPHMMLQLQFPTGETTFRPLDCLEPIAKASAETLTDRLGKGLFGRARDLQRLVTYEKLKGTLHEVIYSMEAAQIDFYPYQFKPVLKFIGSPTERLIIADEVGLGKTIESALIWMELQARHQARRLLVVCPKSIAEKWKEELRSKFLLDARIVELGDLAGEVRELEQNGPSHAFVLISTYTGLRPPKPELALLKEPPSAENAGSHKTEFLRRIRHWSLQFPPFDLVIFDEAHYMRNPATTTFHLGQALASSAGAVLCVSATPVNNSNTDLHSLLRLVDEDFFESQAVFDELLQANVPTVQACNALARTPVDLPLLQSAVQGMGTSRFISESPLFRKFLEHLERFDPSSKANLAVCQDLTEKLNMLGGYLNRTRRVQVKENRPVREAMVRTVNYSTEEMQLYSAILQLVRRRCRLDSRPFHIFQVLGLQLRAASCLPALAREIRAGKLGDPEELFGEAMGGAVTDDIYDEDLEEDLALADILSLLEFDFEADDSKYEELRCLLLKKLPDEKVIIFAFYRATLEYLRRRLLADGVTATVIHGGVPNEQRWVELRRFEDQRGPRVLLSSEVGSEGIDLQFCRVVVNYDLPWNPMRVEQRIGRIDRVGQKAKRISIVNFKVSGTIEERLYDRLHAKLERFANSLGDLEAVIGREVQQLSIDLLSKDLTPEQELQVIEESERVIERRLLEIQALEESGDALIALSDYVQRKIEEDRDKGRYLRPDELEDYVADFFEREFRGSEMNQNTPAPGCLRIRLSQEAQLSLHDFIADDRSLSARPLRQREFSVTFRREVLQQLPSNLRSIVKFINHLSPLVRWITAVNRERSHTFFDVSALLVRHPVLDPGDYCFGIERWMMTGLSKRVRLAYGIRRIADGYSLQPEEAESALQNVLRSGTDWTRVDCDLDELARTHEALEQDFAQWFSIAVEDFEAENQTAHQIKAQRVRGFFDRRIGQDEQRLRTLHEAGRDARIINLTRARLEKAIQNKEQRLNELDAGAKIDMEQASIAAGIFRVVPT